MAEYRQIGSGGSVEGLFVEVSSGDIVYKDGADNIRFRIDNATGNVTTYGTLTGTAGAAAFAALSTTGAVTTASGVGAPAAEGTLVANYGVSKIYNTAVSFTRTLSIAGGNLAGGARVYTMPAVPTLVLGAYASGVVSSATETGTPEVGVGILIGSGTNAVLSGVGATAENIVTGTAIAAVSSGGTAYTLSSANVLLPAVLAASAVIHFNIAGGFSATETLTYSGTLRLLWAAMS